MQKIRLTAVCAVLSCFFAFAGCDADGAAVNGSSKAGEADNTETPELAWGAELESRILQDYFDTFILPEIEHHPEGTSAGDVRINGFDGIYNGGAVVNIRSPRGFPAAIWEERIDNVLFRFHYKDKPVMWKDGLFYEMREAYDAGFLTRDDLIQITAFNERGFCEEMQRSFFLSGLYSNRYFGTYNGYIVLHDFPIGSDWTLAEKGFCLDGAVFLRNGVADARILLWKDGRAYWSQSAGGHNESDCGITYLYGQGELTREDLHLMAVTQIFPGRQMGGLRPEDPENPGAMEALSAETKIRIEEDMFNLWMELYPPDIPPWAIDPERGPDPEYVLRMLEARKEYLRIRSYYGAYNGSVAILIYQRTGGYTAMPPPLPWTVTIDNISFHYPFYYFHDIEINIWREGRFYKLDEAYALGFLSKNDLESIAYILNSGKNLLEEV